jgi:hypothetical protein
MGAKAFTLRRKYHYDRNVDVPSLKQTPEEEQDTCNALAPEIGAP